MRWDSEKSYEAHRNEWREAAVNSSEHRALTFLDDEVSADATVHRMLFSRVDPILDYYPGSDWLTVGDGRYGHDAYYLSKKGGRATATDISDDLLKIAAQCGRLERFSRENAENLSFPDQSFDFVLCKDALHHFSKPFMALYEMLRVARCAVVLIEPNDTRQTLSVTLLLSNFVRDSIKRMLGKSRYVFLGYPNEWENVGNYVYTFSPRDYERLGLSMGLWGAAFCGIEAPPIASGNADPAAELKKKNALRRSLWRMRLFTRLKLKAPGLMATILFKTNPTAELVGALESQGYSLVRFRYPKQAIYQSGAG